jgi:hypothetical protein
MFGNFPRVKYWTLVIIKTALLALFIYALIQLISPSKSEPFAESGVNPNINLNMNPNINQNLRRKQAPKVKLYNPLYTSPDIRSPGSFFYTQPPGDTDAQDFAGTGQGTNGEFFPIQGRAAGVFMKNAADDNTALPSINTGVIGGFPNYNGKDETTSWIGFNNFGYPFNDKPNMISNSYLIQGANKRVADPGRKAEGLDCPDGWPVVEKGENGYCTINNDAMETCDSANRTPQNCGQAGQRFLRNKTDPQWMKVMRQVENSVPK